MHWLKTSEERQSGNVLENPAHPLAKPLLFMGGERTITGRSMDDGRALSIAAIYNAVSVISGDLATIPLKVYRKDGNGRAEENGHALWDLLTLEPSPMLTSAAWRESSQGHILLRGNTYSEVVRSRRGEVEGLNLFNPLDVDRKGEIYRIASEKRMIHAGDMLHVPGPGGNGVEGWSVIKLARESWALASALEESNARFIANASRPSGFLTTEQSMKPETLSKIKRLWGERNSGLDNIGGTPVLDGGFTWQQVGLSAEDAQYIDSRKFSVTDVARWFNVPPHKLKDLERSTFSNVEQQAIDYVMNTLRPWAVRWEQAMNVKLLTAKERKQGLYIAFNLDGLLRGDIQTRSQAYRTQFEMGALTPNEIRELENRNPVENGDDAYVRLDMAPLSKLEEIQAPGSGDEPTGRAETRSREIRSPDLRLQLRSSFEPLILEAAGRMVRGEVRNIKRLLQRSQQDELRSRIESYYFDEHPEFAAKVMGPIFRSYAESVSVAAAAEVESKYKIDAVTYADTYTESFVNRYSARSRRDLIEKDPEQIEQRLQVWTDGDAGQEPRDAQVANREVVKLGEAVARSVFVSAGILSIVWRSIGDSCPYCKRLDGKVVSTSAPFIAAGEAFEGEGSDVPLIPKSPVSHAPAHRGCNCIIVPGV